jgi:hypothetical protein
MSFLDYLRREQKIGDGKYEQYLPIYERHLNRWKGLSPTILEIGVAGGTSMAMWRVFFGAHAKIFGIDINVSPAPYRSRVFIGKQQDTVFLEKILNFIGTPDIVIDDGSHIHEDMRTTFEFIYPRMSKHGVYIVEDLHASREFLDYSKNLTDQLTVAWSSLDNQFHKTTMSMHFYESMVVFERGEPYAGDFPGSGILSAEM